MSLAVRADDLAELMDDPACDPVRLARTLRRFAVVNPLVAAWAPVYRTRIRPFLASRPGGAPVRILDVGCGGGDVLRRLVTAARRDGFAVSGVGIDPDPRAIAVATDAASLAGVEFRPIDSGALAAAGERFDVVVSNHVLHHLPPDAVGPFLAESATLASGVCLHSDIARSRTAFAAYAVGITPLAPGSFLRTDGLRSIRRSWTAGELAAVVPPGWRVERPAAFRLLAVHAQGAAGGAPGDPRGGAR